MPSGSAAYEIGVSDSEEVDSVSVREPVEGRRSIGGFEDFDETGLVVESKA